MSNIAVALESISSSWGAEGSSTPKWRTKAIWAVTSDPELDYGEKLKVVHLFKQDIAAAVGQRWRIVDYLHRVVSASVGANVPGEA